MLIPGTTRPLEIPRLGGGLQKARTLQGIVNTKTVISRGVTDSMQEGVWAFSRTAHCPCNGCLNKVVGEGISRQFARLANNMGALLYLQASTVHVHWM